MMMKKKLLAAAIVATLGSVGSAQAVYLADNEGTGEVLIFPYYTVQGGFQTLVRVTNSTDDVVAVKVRFREPLNSAEVLDFNLYLSPHDVWTGQVLAEGDDAARLITHDTSCTVPKIPEEGVLFRNLAYLGDSGGDGLERTREGYLEIIQMGIVDDGILAEAATHEAGVPKDCELLNAAWLPHGVWDVDSEAGMSAPEGGLFGSVGLINIDQGVEYSTNATALQEWSDEVKHFSTGTESPRLGDASPPVSKVFTNGELVEDLWFGTEPSPGLNAVSAVMMAKYFANGWTANPAVGAETDLVTTFPTKRQYTQPEDGTDLEADLPFTHNFILGKACETALAGHWNREEEFEIPDSPPNDFSPQPQPEDVIWEVCYEANVINMGSGPSDVLASSLVNNVFPLAHGFVNGWFRITFSDANFLSNELSGNVYEGLPVIGFAASRILNEGVGVGAAYAATNSHRYERIISGAESK